MVGQVIPPIDNDLQPGVVHQRRLIAGLQKSCAWMVTTAEAREGIDSPSMTGPRVKKT
jgi:hypothetical protein